jgi:hypothetical protein
VFAGPFAYLKHHLKKFVQDAFFDKQDAEIDIAWPFDNMNHRFIDITKVVF